MSIEQERAAFEAWYQHHHGDRDVYVLDESGEYADKQVQGAFNVWQARAALSQQPEVPRVNIRCEATFGDGVGASTYLNVLRVEREDDGTLTAVTDHWPAAAGEEIMVNAAHDVYTLPLQPSGLSSGPRFVVHVPGPEQQPAAPSETVNVIGMPEFDGLLDHIYEYGTAAEGVIEKANAFARAVIARYAPQQPAAVDEALDRLRRENVPCLWHADLAVRMNIPFERA